MVKSTADAEREALKPWYKPLLDKVVKEMQRLKAVKGAAIEAIPVWVLPYKILISKVWGVGQKNRFIWTISGESVVTDYIPGNLAVTPKDAAKHFSLKWQMDAERLLEAVKYKTPIESIQLNMRKHANKLIQNAEFLYELTEQDDIWL